MATRSGVAQELVDIIADAPMWMALSSVDPASGLAEPEGGYERLVVLPSDWTDGVIAPKSFGPAQRPWIVTHVALLRFDGEPVMWVALDGLASVAPGQMFTYEMRVAVAAA